MDILCCQIDTVWENKAANHAAVTALLDAAAPAPGTLVVLPEMFATGFSMNVGAISDTPKGETQEFLAKTAAQRSVYILAGLAATGADGRGRNEAVLYSPDGHAVARYHKLHPFNPGGEGKHYAAGLRIITARCGEFTLCPFICYDVRFPEIFRQATRRGANLFVVVANWPASREHHWLTLLAARAIENQAYVAGSTRCGSDPSVMHCGRSVIIDPRGNIIADAGSRPGTISARIRLDALVEYRREFPVLADLRGEFFGPP